MKIVLDNGKEFGLRHHMVRAAASVLERSPECHVSLQRADGLAEQMLIAAAQTVVQGRRRWAPRGTVPSRPS